MTLYSELSERDRQKMLEAHYRIIEILEGPSARRHQASSYSLLERSVDWVFSVVIERPVTRGVEAFLSWLQKKLDDRQRR